MKNRYRLLTATLFVTTLLTTGCSLQNDDSPDEKKQQTLQENNDSLISVKEAIEENTNLVNEISALETEISTLEKKINETNPGADRAKIVEKIVPLENKIEEKKNQQIDNAKAFKVSQQKKSEQAAITEEKEATVN